GSGSPGRGAESDAVIACDLLGFGALGLRVPYVVVAVAIAQEGNPLAVGREARLTVVSLGVAVFLGGVAERQTAGGAADDRHGVKITEQLENDGLAVGRYIEREPSGFVGRELDLAGGLQREPALLRSLLWHGLTGLVGWFL